MRKDEKTSLHPITTGPSKSRLITGRLTTPHPPPPHLQIFCRAAGIHPGLEETNTASWQSTRLLLISPVYRAEGQFAGPLMSKRGPAADDAGLFQVEQHCVALANATPELVRSRKKNTQTVRRERITAGERVSRFFFFLRTLHPFDVS